MIASLPQSRTSAFRRPYVGVDYFGSLLVNKYREELRSVVYLLNNHKMHKQILTTSRLSVELLRAVLTESEMTVISRLLNNIYHEGEEARTPNHFLLDSY